MVIVAFRCRSTLLTLKAYKRCPLFLSLAFTFASFTIFSLLTINIAIILLISVLIDSCGSRDYTLASHNFYKYVHAHFSRMSPHQYPITDFLPSLIYTFHKQPLIVTPFTLYRDFISRTYFVSVNTRDSQP